MNIRKLYRIAAFVALLLPLQAWPEPMTKAQGDAILQELRAIRLALERQGGAAPGADVPAARARVEIKGYPTLGNARAPVSTVMFTDYECPYCRSFMVETFPQLKKEFIDTGKLKFVMRDMPLEMHSDAQRAAEAIQCVNEQNLFWPMVERLASINESPSVSVFTQLTDILGGDPARIVECVADGRHTAKVKASVEEAQRLGITGTPTFIIGHERGGAVEGERVVGALPFATFQRKVSDMMPRGNAK